MIPLELADKNAEALLLPGNRHWPETHHVFDIESVWAVNAALAAGRPLLIRGEPGMGKTQLARAAAVALNRPLLAKVVNARLEPEDLLFRFDAVARLAKAQILPREMAAMKELEPELFLLPEVLWWAIDPSSAATQHDKASPQCGEAVCRYDEGCTPALSATSGAVVLIDEIDKADTEVPNSLLEILSVGGFQLPFGRAWVGGGKGPAPLIILTTNEDRELPAAFLRRCLVHHMELPREEGPMAARLERLVRAHPDLAGIGRKALEMAIQQLRKDRAAMEAIDLNPPGQAELIDLLRAVVNLAKTEANQIDVLERIQNFAFRKHREGGSGPGPGRGMPSSQGPTRPS